MFQKYCPTWRADSAFSLTPETLRQQNVHGLMIDLDNTLVPWYEKQAQEHLNHWLMELSQAGIKVVIVSNNHRHRITPILEKTDTFFVSAARKPSRSGLKRALNYLSLSKDQVLMVGDQVMTDILAANRFGVRSILVTPLVSSDGILTYINRAVERMILKRLINQGKLVEWSDTING